MLATGTQVQLVGNEWVGYAIALVWLVGVTNAFNLLDNMDGLAATLAAIAFGFFAIDAVTVHDSHLILAFALAGAAACVGFLPFNLRRDGRALVFMGDSGSLTLGFALAALGLAASWRVAGTTVATLVLPILILAVPILDTALVTVVRLLEGRPIYQGGRDHTLAPARALRALRAARRAAARADRDRHRRLEPRLQRARQRPLDDRRRRLHVRAARPVRELPRRHRAPAASTRRAGRVHRRHSPSTGGASSRCSSTSS